MAIEQFLLMVKWLKKALISSLPISMGAFCYGSRYTILFIGGKFFCVMLNVSSVATYNVDVRERSDDYKNIKLGVKKFKDNREWMRINHQNQKLRTKPKNINQ